MAQIIKKQMYRKNTKYNYFHIEWFLSTYVAQKKTLALKWFYKTNTLKYLNFQYKPQKTNETV